MIDKLSKDRPKPRLVLEDDGEDIGVFMVHADDADAVSKAGAGIISSRRDHEAHVFFEYARNKRSELQQRLDGVDNTG
jgi:hypothetical protein